MENDGFKELCKQFTSTLNLHGILLASTTASRKPEINFPVTISVNREFSFSGEPSDEDNNRINYIIKSNHVLIAKGNNKKNTLKIEATYICFYSSEVRLKDDNDPIFHHFVDNIVTLHVWPYFREHVQSLVAKMGLPLITLDVIPI